MPIVVNVTVNDQGVLIEFDHPHVDEKHLLRPRANRIVRVISTVTDACEVQYPSVTTVLFVGQQENSRINTKSALQRLLDETPIKGQFWVDRFSLLSIDGYPLTSIQEAPSGEKIIVDAVVATSQFFTVQDANCIRAAMDGRQVVRSDTGRLLLVRFHSQPRDVKDLDRQLVRLIKTVRAALGEAMGRPARKR